MKKFEFELETVLKIKCRIEEQRKIELHQAQTERSEAERRLNQRQNEVSDMSRRYQKFMTGRFDPALATYYHYYLTWLNQMLDQDRQYLEFCDSMLEKARYQLSEAAKERKILDKLKEKAYQEYKARELYEEIKFLDELGTNRFFDRDPENTPEHR